MQDAERVDAAVEGVSILAIGDIENVLFVATKEEVPSLDAKVWISSDLGVNLVAVQSQESSGFPVSDHGIVSLAIVDYVSRAKVKRASATEILLVLDVAVLHPDRDPLSIVHESALPKQEAIAGEGRERELDLQLRVGHFTNQLIAQPSIPHPGEAALGEVALIRGGCCCGGCRCRRRKWRSTCWPWCKGIALQALIESRSRKSFAGEVNHFCHDFVGEAVRDLKMDIPYIGLEALA